MKASHFDTMKPQSNHESFMPDFIAGYESVQVKLQSYSAESLQNEFNENNPSGHKPSSLAAYFYAKGELAAMLDS